MAARQSHNTAGTSSVQTTDRYYKSVQMAAWDILTALGDSFVCLECLALKRYIASPTLQTLIVAIMGGYIGVEVDRSILVVRSHAHVGNNWEFQNFIFIIVYDRPFGEIDIFLI